jgi:hypothetical protein
MEVMMKRVAFLILVLSISLFLCSEDVEFHLNMNYQISAGNFDPAIDFVDVAGNFNEWGATPITGTDPDEDGIYTLLVENLEIGFVCEYKFRINGSWNNSEFPGGGANRSYTVVAGENIVEHWYNDEILPSIYVDIIFNIIDGTQNYADIKFKSSFDEWVLHTMADDGEFPDEEAGDHIWSVLVQDIPDGTHTWGAIEDDGSQWGIWLIEGDDLEFSVDDEGNVSGQTVYFVDPGSTQDVTVTFQLDVSLMQNVGEITVAGTFNNWNITQSILEDPDQDDIYTIDILIPSGSQLNQQYKYLNDGSYEDIDNRSFILDDTIDEQVLPIDYFDNLNPADFIEENMILTTYVDMEETEFDSVAICGNVAPLDWDFAAHNNPLTWHEGTIWTIELEFLQGSYRYLNFKFATDGEDLESGYNENHTVTLDEALGHQTAWCVYGEMGPTSKTDDANLSPAFLRIVNYPNPFNPETIISFSIPESINFTEVAIYNVKGQKIRTLIRERLSPGEHKVLWDGKDNLDHPCATGIYFCLIKAGSQIDSHKMILIK